MKITSEWDLIDRIGELVRMKGLPQPASLIRSIGEDCAVCKRKGGICLLTTDISIESVHFRRTISPPADIGYKAMTGNISDVASMGGRPLYALIALAVPENLEVEFILELYDGFLQAANKSGAIIAGGDISRGSEIVISISLYGEAAGKGVMTRSGAKAGDIIYVTGETGGSMAGLEIIESGKTDMADRFKNLVARHRRPEARLSIVAELQKRFAPTSMIDISDGLISDMKQICRESRAGFRIDRELIPVSKDLREYAGIMKRDPFYYAMESGEEYELLFTSRKKGAIMAVQGIPVTPIGSITGSGYSVPGMTIDFDAGTGYDHFNARDRRY